MNLDKELSTAYVLLAVTLMSLSFFIFSVGGMIIQEVS